MTLRTLAPALLLVGVAVAAEPPAALAPFFRPPAEFADLGPQRSPLKFDVGTPVRTAADWEKRRKEILAYWHGAMGAWPPVSDKPRIDYLA